MKFFIPEAKDKQQENEAYSSIKKFVSQQVGGDILDTKIYKINFKHDGKEYSATIGETTNFNGEMAIAIFEADNLYLLCTLNRGVKRGDPILVGKNLDTSVIFFD